MNLNLKWEDHFGDLDVDGNIILKWNVGYKMWECVHNSTDSGWNVMTDFCRYASESSRLIKATYFFYQLSNYQFFKEIFTPWNYSEAGQIILTDSPSPHVSSLPALPFLYTHSSTPVDWITRSIDEWRQQTGYGGRVGEQALPSYKFLSPPPGTILWPAQLQLVS
jgi:hypothetical protein